MTKAIDQQLHKNKTGNINVKFHFTSNGAGYKQICSRLYFALNEASWTAHAYLQASLSDLSIEDIINTPVSQLQIDMSLLVPTMKLAIKYSAHKWMRRGWAGFWASKYTVTAHDIIPRELTDAKYYWRKGFNMLQSCAPEMVCYDSQFIVCGLYLVIDFVIY